MTLIAAFGNQYRRDDGVGYVVVNIIREWLGRPALTPLAETVAAYGLLIFIDAHVPRVLALIDGRRAHA
ncbi:MAG: hypothetical protein K8R89_07280 [Anaerolineae bacterium]|nr:hypothetical protein [Anaerolineae bacterium]